jgi:hypothetical protein
MRNTADVTGGKPIAVLLQSISGVIAINPFVAFYNIRGGNENDPNSVLTHKVPIEYVQSTARHAIELQFDISANALEIRVLKIPKCLIGATGNFKEVKVNNYLDHFV